MRALLLSEYKKLNVVDMPLPEIGDEDVLVRVRACGICGSDIHGYDGSTGRRIPPLVMGHEAAGVIERAGRAVNAFKVGDRVTFDSTVSCGKWTLMWSIMLMRWRQPCRTKYLARRHSSLSSSEVNGGFRTCPSLSRSFVQMSIPIRL